MCEILDPGQCYKIREAVIKFEDIGGFTEVKKRLEEMVSLPLKYPEAFKKADLRPRNGILMWGPPKTSMRTLAEAAASDANAMYISVEASRIIENEHQITHLYKDATKIAPCVIFINEIEVLAPRREAQSGLLEPPRKIAPPNTTRRFLREIDKSAKNDKVITIGGSNRPDIIDPALLRNGRLDRKIYVPAPDYYDRLEILRLSLKKIPLAEDASPEVISEITENYSSSDLISLPREATLIAIKENGKTFEKVSLRHFKEAMKRIPPSLSPELISRYEEIYKEECKHRYMY
jgi:transitional endoplasmic reticulum ATPase